MEREKIFKQRAQEFSTLEIKLNRKYNVYSTVRVVLFIVATLLAIYFANERQGTGVTAVVLLFPIVFGLLVNRHNLLAKKRDTSRYLATINRHELQRLAGDIKTFADGLAYQPQQHAYAKDMDVFGRNSVYQLLNRTNTPSGKETMANWLSNLHLQHEIVQRQESVTELIDQVEWRQQFQAAGMSQKENEHSFQTVIQWINAPSKIKYDGLTKMLAFLLPIVMVTLIACNIFTELSIYYTLGLAVINSLVLRKYAFYVTDITESTNKGLQSLKAYGELIGIIEKSEFKASYLSKLKAVFSHDQFSASRSIMQLQKILEFLHGRANMFYLFFNLILLFDIHLLVRAERWKQKQKEDVNLWFERIGEFEAVNSLSGFAYANPDYTMPHLVEEPFKLKATQVGHPLINHSERITNDFEMNDEGSISLITGSNMSGKSTFLRTIGVNMILAYAGAPVCAASMSLSLMQLFTSMRTEDNLEEHISSFYAELQRIKQLLALVEKEVPVLFMLDEILKGTNSHDRHAGAEALIRQLSKKKAMGFVSTHDLALGKLSNELADINNFSFNSQIEGDKIIFKYKLESGLCHSFNASKLMEQIGIDMNFK